MHQIESEFYPKLNIEPSARTKKETLQRQQRERAKSDFDREILKEEVFYKIRLVDSPSERLRAAVSSDRASVDSEGVSSQRVCRRLSLNCEKSQDPLLDYVPFNHKELYPSSVQKYLAKSQSSRKFLVGEAISKLKIPQKKSHIKNLDKMRLLGLVQERQIDELMKSWCSQSTGSETDSPFKVFSPMNTEHTNISDLTHSKPSKFSQEVSQEFSPARFTSPLTSETNTLGSYQGNHNEFYGYGDIQANNNAIQGMQDSFQPTGLVSNQLPSSYCQGKFQYPQHQNDYGNEQGFGCYLATRINPPVLDQRSYPYNAACQNGVYDNLNPTSMVMGTSLNENEDFNMQNRSASQNAVCSRPSSVKDLADQQLMKINNLLVRKPKRLYKLNTIDVVPSTGNCSSQYYSPGVDSPSTPRSDCSLGNLNLTGSLCPATFSTSMTAELSNSNNEVNSINSIKTDDKKSEGNIAEQPNNLASLLVPPAKKTRKPVYRMNTDPTHLDSLIQTMNFQSPLSNSPNHSKSPSNSGPILNLTPLSQFGLMKPNNAQNPTYANTPSLIQGSGPMLASGPTWQNLPRGLHAAITNTPSITETLQENLPASPKKKRGVLYKMNTDPTNLTNYSAIEASNLPEPIMSLSQLSENTSTHQATKSWVSEDNKFSTGTLNEKLSQMTLTSDCGEAPLWNIPDQTKLFNQGNAQTIFDNYPSCFSQNTQNCFNPNLMQTTMNNHQPTYNYKTNQTNGTMPFLMPEYGFRTGNSNGVAFETDFYPS